MVRWSSQCWRSTGFCGTLTVSPVGHWPGLRPHPPATFFSSVGRAIAVAWSIRDDSSVDERVTGGCERCAELASERDGLRVALENRDVIGQAKGILMATMLVTAEEAFDLLREASMRRNRKLRDLADDVARTGML